MAGSRGLLTADADKRKNQVLKKARGSSSLDLSRAVRDAIAALSRTCGRLLMLDGNGMGKWSRKRRNERSDKGKGGEKQGAVITGHHKCMQNKANVCVASKEVWQTTPGLARQHHLWPRQGQEDHVAGFPESSCGRRRAVEVSHASLSTKGVMLHGKSVRYSWVDRHVAVVHSQPLLSQSLPETADVDLRAALPDVRDRTRHNRRVSPSN